MPTSTASQWLSEDWQLSGSDEAKPLSMVVQCRRRGWVFPWMRFVWGEGDSSQVKIAFATHMVTVTGHGLAVLLAAVSDQRVIRLIEPSENDAKFGVRNGSGLYSGPSISAISVRSFAEDSE